MQCNPHVVMPALVAGIHVLDISAEVVGGRDKPRHDGKEREVQYLLNSPTSLP